MTVDGVLLTCGRSPAAMSQAILEPRCLLPFLGQLIFVFVALMMHGAGLPGDLDLKIYIILFVFCLYDIIKLFTLCLCRCAIGSVMSVGCLVFAAQGTEDPAGVTPLSKKQN